MCDLRRSQNQTEASSLLAQWKALSTVKIQQNSGVYFDVYIICKSRVTERKQAQINPKRNLKFTLNQQQNHHFDFTFEPFQVRKSSQRTMTMKRSGRFHFDFVFASNFASILRV